MKIQCPECGGRITFKRIEDSWQSFEIKEDGEADLDTHVDKQNGCSQVYCSNDKSHELTEEIVDAVIEIGEESCY